MEGGNESNHVYVESMDETQILSSILWVSELIGNETDMGELLQLIVELTPKLINLNRCTIFLWDEEKKEFVPRISYSPEREERKNHLAGFYAMRLKPEEIPELAEKLMNEKVPVVISNAKKSTHIPKKYVEFFKIKSALVIPLLCKGEFIGVMTLDHIKDFHHFTQKEIRVAMGLATHAALAIKNAQLISSLTEERNKTKRIIETMAEGMLVIAPDRKVIMTNSEMERLTGLRRKDMVGSQCYNVYNGGVINERGNYCVDSCPIAIKSEEKTKVEGVIRTRDGREVWVSSNYSHARDIDGNILYTVVTVRDTSETKWMEDKLNTLYRKLQIDKIGVKRHDETPKGGF